MWTLVTTRIESTDQAERDLIQRKLTQGLLQRPWVSLFPGCVAVDMFGPADIDQIGGVLEAIASEHPNRLYYAGVALPVGAFPRLRPKLPFDEATFREIVGPRRLAASPEPGEAFWAFDGGIAPRPSSPKSLQAKGSAARGKAKKRGRRA